MRKIVYTLPDGQQVAALLRTALFDELTRADDVQWVLLSPLANNAEFCRQFAHPRVEVKHLPRLMPNFWERQFEFLKREFINRRLDAESRKIQYRRLRACEPKRYFFHRPAALALGWVPGIHWLVDRLQDLGANNRAVEAVLEAVQPDAVILGSGAVKISDVPVGRWARRRGVPVFGIIPSWDNLAIKGPTCRSDHIAVWNDSMREQALTTFGYKPEQVSITGPQVFDVYAQSAPRFGREEFLTRMGLEPERKLITYTTMPPFNSNFAPHFVHLVAGWIAEERLPVPCQLLVRLHPQDDPALYEECKTLPNVCIDMPGRFRKDLHANVIVAYDPSSEDVAHLRDSLLYSDVVLNIASTITLEACVLDRPVVNLAYNPAGSNWPVTIADYYYLAHYKPVTLSGAVRLARSEEELLAGIGEALLHPEYRREERKRLYQSMVTYTDGRCAMRLAEAIWRFVGASVSRKVSPLAA
jgi:hypothetical protein